MSPTPSMLHAQIDNILAGMNTPMLAKIALAGENICIIHIRGSFKAYV
jgi:hypothetical protein